MNCVACQESFSSSWTQSEHLASLVHHVRLQHIQPTCRHSCPLCDFVCAELSDYSKHIDSDSHKDKLGQFRRKRAIFEDIGGPGSSSSSHNAISGSAAEEVDPSLMNEKGKSTSHDASDQHDLASKNTVKRGKYGGFNHPETSTFDRRHHSNRSQWNEFYEPSAAEMSNFEFSCNVAIPGRPLQAGMLHGTMNDARGWYGPGFPEPSPFLYQQVDPGARVFSQDPYLQNCMLGWGACNFSWPQQSQMMNFSRPVEDSDGGAKKKETLAQHFSVEASGSSCEVENGGKLTTDYGNTQQPAKDSVPCHVQNQKPRGLKKKKKKKRSNGTCVAGETSLGSRITIKHPLKRNTVAEPDESSESQKAESCEIPAAIKEVSGVDGSKANDTNSAADEKEKKKTEGPLRPSESRCRPKTYLKSPLKMDAKMKRAFYDKLAMKNKAKYVHSMSLMMCRKRHDKYHLISRSESADETLDTDGNAGSAVEDILPHRNFTSSQAPDTRVDAVSQTQLSAIPGSASLKVTTSHDSTLKVPSAHFSEKRGDSSTKLCESTYAAVAATTGRMEDSGGILSAGRHFLPPVTAKAGTSSFDGQNTLPVSVPTSELTLDSRSNNLPTAESQLPHENLTLMPSMSQTSESGRVSVKVENVDAAEIEVPYVSSGCSVHAYASTHTFSETAQSADWNFPSTSADERGTPHSTPAVDESKLKHMWSLIAEERSLGSCITVSNERIANLHLEIAAEQQKLAKMEARSAEIRRQIDDMLRDAGDGAPLCTEQNFFVRKVEPQ